jgi:hypothetical protein
MFLVLQVLAVVGIIVAAITGKGTRGSYFAGAVAATLLGLAFLSIVSTPAQLLAVSGAERVGAERLNTLAPVVAWTLFAAAIGAVIGGCVFRAPRVVDNSEAHDVGR